MKIILYALFLPLLSYSTILPESHITAPISHVKDASMTKERFNKLISQVVDTYRVTFKEFGMGRLILNKKWENDKINASAAKRGTTFLINVYGGLGRYETITDDGFILILCHEIGHLIGGAPTIKPQNNVSSEGQADYFSTAKCFRKVAKQFPTDLGKLIDIHPVARVKCQEVFKSKDDLQICYRSSLGQESLALTFSKLSERLEVPQFDTPDPNIRNLILFNGYPTIQCRFDTLFSGSLCHRPEDELLSFELYNHGVCSVPNGDGIGIRPSCWYAPRVDI